MSTDLTAVGSSALCIPAARVELNMFFEARTAGGNGASASEIILPNGAVAACTTHGTALKVSSSTTKKTPATGAAAG